MVATIAINFLLEEKRDFRFSKRTVRFDCVLATQTVS